MPFDFDKNLNRKNANSYKWDIKENELPMWVADMDFDTPPFIVNAINKRVAQGALGYNIIPSSFNDNIRDWWSHQHGYTIDSEWILFCTGVVAAIASVIRNFTKIDDNVVILSPVYNVFFNIIRNNKREVLASSMKYENYKYTIDFEDLEDKLSQKDTTMMIFCNPHNPTGEVWAIDDLQRVGDLCVKYDVLLVSDEIHCDLTHGNNQYTPMASVSKEIENQTITCVSPSKAFNIAGLQTSAIIAANPEIRERVDWAINNDEIREPNSFAIQVTEAAFNEGQDWLNQLKKYLDENQKILSDFLKDNISEIKMVKSNATYLAWLDCSAISEDTDELSEFIRSKTGLYLSKGSAFGGNGKQFLRLNYACSRARLYDGLNRFKEAIIQYK